MEPRSGELASVVSRLSQCLPATREGRQQATECAWYRLFSLDRHGAKRVIEVDGVLRAIHAHEMTYRPRMRTEGYIGGHATGKHHYAQFIEDIIGTVMAQFPPTDAAGDNFQRSVGKERRNFVDSVIDNILLQLAGQ